jgi:hypothetical protein
MPHLNASETQLNYPVESDWEAVFGGAADKLADCCSDQPRADCFE